MDGVKAKPKVAEAPKDFEFVVVGLRFVKMKVSRVIFKNRCRHSIDQVYSSEEGVGPKFERDFGSVKESEAYFNKMKVSSLSGSIMFRSVRESEEVRDSIGVKKIF